MDTSTGSGVAARLWTSRPSLRALALLAFAACSGASMDTSSTTTEGDVVACGTDENPPAGSACDQEGMTCNNAMCVSPCGCQGVVCEGGVWNTVPDPPECEETTGTATDPTTTDPTTTGPTTGATETTDPTTTDPTDPTDTSSTTEEPTTGTGTSTGQPLPSCEDVCDEVVAAGCDFGPPDAEACVKGCDENLMGDCAAEQEAVLACGGPDPEVICDEFGRPMVETCEAVFFALYGCLGI